MYSPLPMAQPPLSDRFDPRIGAAMDRYMKHEKIGGGSFGDVYKSMDTQTNRFVALKRIKDSELSDIGIPGTALREIILLLQLNHPNVVKLENVVMQPGMLYLVYEFLDLDLNRYLHNLSKTKQSLDHKILKSYSAQLLDGLDYCHSMGVMHRDLKPQNVLLRRDGTLKLADFGLARAFTSCRRPLTKEVITLWYKPPELLLGLEAYSKAVDVWSAGCIIAEMANFQPIFRGDSEIGMLHKIFSVVGTPTATTWPSVVGLPYWRSNFPQWGATAWNRAFPTLTEDGIDLIISMLRCDPSRRVTAAGARRHPFVADDVRDVCTPLTGSGSPRSSPSSSAGQLQRQHQAMTPSPPPVEAVAVAVAPIIRPRPVRPSNVPQEGPYFPPPREVAEVTLEDCTISDGGAGDDDDMEGVHFRGAVGQTHTHTSTRTDGAHTHTSTRTDGALVTISSAATALVMDDEDSQGQEHGKEHGEEQHSFCTIASHMPHNKRKRASGERGGVGDDINDDSDADARCDGVADVTRPNRRLDPEQRAGPL